MATPGGRGMPSRTISSRATTSAWTSMGSNSTPQDDKSSFVLAQDDQPGRVYRRAFIACHYTRWGAPTWPPKPPNVRTAPAEPGRSSIMAPNPQRSDRPGGAGALLYLPSHGGGDFFFA